jgi:hypothetical protein
VPAAAALVANDRYVVGFDERDWPVFRVDTSELTLTDYAVSDTSELVSFRDPRYVEVPGDILYQEHYAPRGPNAQVLDDGSVAVVLRDARQARLWSLSPEDTAFRPLGRPFTGVIDLSWNASDHYFQVAGDPGNCYCVPPALRWEAGADSDVMPANGVQIVSRTQPSHVVVLPNHRVTSDETGACVLEPTTPFPLVHDLPSSTVRALETANGDVRFFSAE